MAVLKEGIRSARQGGNGLSGGIINIIWRGFFFFLLKEAEWMMGALYCGETWRNNAC